MKEPEKYICPHCGSNHTIKKSKRETKTGIYRRVFCKDCNKYSQHPLFSASEDSSKMELTTNEKILINKVLNHQLLTNEQKKEQLDKIIPNKTELIKLPINSSMLSEAKGRKLKDSQIYIITSAQNSTPVNQDVLNSIIAYANFLGAEIGIILTRYQNPTSTYFWNNDEWDSSVYPYMIASRQTISNKIDVLADLKILATSPNPTGNINLFGDNRSCIVGSARQELISCPVFPDEENKFIWATGTITEANFTDTVAGGKAAEHHTYGFIIVEVDNDGTVYTRNVNMRENGDFDDLDYNVRNCKVEKENNITSFTWGDSHFSQFNESIFNTFMNFTSKYSIDTIFLHDVFDALSINVHAQHNGVTKYFTHTKGANLYTELEDMYIKLEMFEKLKANTYVVASNHDNMLDRAMYQLDWKDNPENSLMFVELLYRTLKGEMKKGIIASLINERFEHVKGLSYDDSFVLHNCEMALHGDKGANGSRGSILQFSKMPFKTITGHSHQSGIKGGAYSVGISCDFNHGYNKGVTSWNIGGVIMHNTGKRQQIIFNKFNLKYTTL